MELKEKIKAINTELDFVIRGDMSKLKEIDDLTMDAIAHDYFDSLPEALQDALYLLNNYEFENPAKSEIAEAANEIKQFLGID